MFFCPVRTEADPYAVPNDLQELIRRIQRLKNADEVDFVATPMVLVETSSYPINAIHESLTMNFYENS